MVLSLRVKGPLLRGLLIGVLALLLLGVVQAALPKRRSASLLGREIPRAL